ncbi:MAG: tyrosine-type recombinase/integrase [Acidimicrobiia bacterium]
MVEPPRPAPPVAHSVNHWLHRVWYPARAKAGLDWLQFHDLRRANATGLVLEGVDLKTAQTRLGHTDPRLTLGIYAQATTEADRQAADRLGERFPPDRTKAADGASPERRKESSWSHRHRRVRRHSSASTLRSSSATAGISPVAMTQSCEGSIRW